MRDPEPQPSDGMNAVSLILLFFGLAILFVGLGLGLWLITIGYQAIYHPDQVPLVGKVLALLEKDDAFFEQVKSFTPMRTDAEDLEAGLTEYLDQLEAIGGVDIFFLGHGPEAEAASHLAYIKPRSGATVVDVAGLIPISSSILEHHVTKFKAGGSQINPEDEAECRRATHILTLGPAAILGARRIVQSIVDAETAPAKRASYQRVRETPLSDDLEVRAKQLDENPGLWVRLHPNVRSLVLPNVIA